MKLWMSILLLIPASALTQDFRNMSESDMAAMMQQVQQMQSCIAKVDQGELKALEKRSQQLSGEVKHCVPMEVATRPRRKRCLSAKK